MRPDTPLGRRCLKDAEEPRARHREKSLRRRLQDEIDSWQNRNKTLYAYVVVVVTLVGFFVRHGGRMTRTIVLLAFFATTPGTAQVLRQATAPVRREPIAFENLVFERTISDFNMAFDAYISLAEPVWIELISGDSCPPWGDGWNPQTRSIQICWNTLFALRNSRPTTANQGWDPVPTLSFIVAHELAHALIDLLALPVVGDEEVAADQFAVVLFAERDKHEKSTAPPAIQTGYHSAIAWGRNLLETVGVPERSGVLRTRHGSSVQRAYRITCVWRGARKSHPNPLLKWVADSVLSAAWVDSFASIDNAMDVNYLGGGRVEECDQEYVSIVRRWERLLDGIWSSGGNH